MSPPTAGACPEPIPSAFAIFGASHDEPEERMIVHSLSSRGARRLRLALLPLLMALLAFPARAADEGESRELDYARRLHRDGVYDLAAEQCEQIRRRWPDSARLDEVYQIEGDSRFAIGDYEEARRAFQRLSLQAAESPLAAMAQVRAADCLVLLGRGEEAAQSLRRVAEYHPESAEAAPALLRAEALWPADDLDARRDILARLLRDYGDRTEAVEARRRLAGNWRARGELQRAERELDATIRLATPGETMALAAVEWAELLAARHRAPEAVARLSELQTPLAATRWRGMTRRCEASLRLRLGQAAEAEPLLASWTAAFDPALDDEAGTDSLRVLLGDARVRLGRYADAAAAYARCGQGPPTRRWRLAWSLQQAGRPLEAAAVWRPLIAELAAPDPPLPSREARLLAGAVDYLLASGEPANDELWNRASRALAQPPEGYEAPLALVDGLLAAGQLDAAAALLAPQDGPLADDRALRRMRLSAARAEWGRVGRLREEFHRKYPLSPLLPDVEREYAAGWRRHVESAALNEELLGFLVRQNAGEDPAEMALAFGRLYLEKLGRPELAEPQFRLAAESPVDSVRCEAWWGLAGVFEARGRRAVADSLLAARGAELSRSPRAWDALRRTLPGGERPLVELDDTVLENRAALLMRAETALPAGQGDRARRERLETLRLRMERSSGAVGDTLATRLLALLPGDASLDADEIGLRASALERLGRVDEALVQWRLLLQEHPESSASVDAELAIASQPGTPDAERMELLERVRRLRPYHPAAEQARLLLAGLLLRQGRAAEALPIYDEMLAKAEAAATPIEMLPAPAPALLFQRALCLDRLGPPAVAREAWLHYLAGAGGDGARVARGLLQLGQTWLDDGRPDEALRAWRNLQTVLGGTPEAREALARMAAVYSSSERHAEALTALEELQAGRSADPVLRARWVGALYRAGRLDQGRDELTRLLKESGGLFDEDTLQASMNLAKGRWLLSKQQFDEATKSLQYVLKKYPDAPAAAPAQLELARARAGAGRGEDALELLDGLSKRWPGSREAARAAVLKGGLLRQAGDTQRAVGEFRRAVDEAPDDETRRFALDNLIASYRELGFLEGALQGLRRYLELWPDGPERFAKRLETALLLKESGDLDSATDQLRRLLPEADLEDEAAIQYYLGECAQQKGDWQGAILEYMKVPYLGRTKLDWDVTALYQAAQCWEQLLQPQRAVQLYERIVRERGPGSSYGKAAQERLNLLRYRDSEENRP